MPNSAAGLTVAVTGPTGDIGRALLRRLDRERDVARVIGMARRPFDPEAQGLRKVEYRQGDVTDRDSVQTLIDGADVVVHLAFLIFGSLEETTRVNLDGCDNVFRASLDAGVRRLVYTSSVAAYGFHDDNPTLLSEDVPPRGTEEHYYSAQKAELENKLRDMAAGTETELYVFRPCIVAGPTALSLIQKIPYVAMAERLPAAARKIMGSLPLLRPVIPDPGVPFQLVHEDDVAQALTAAIRGEGEPGTYNLAADGEITLTDMAHALRWYALPIPDIAVDATVSIVSRLPMLPTEARWINAIRVPVLVDTSKAKDKLSWVPRYDALDTLAETIRSAREEGLRDLPSRHN